MKRMFFNVLSVVCASTLMLVSCSKSSDSNSPATSKVMVIHASPDAPGVDLYIDSVKQNTSAVNYLDNTAYLNVNSGLRNFKIKVAGTSTTVINANVNLVNGKNYSVFAIDSVASIEPIVFVDSFYSVASNQCLVRFIHLSPNAPAVNVSAAGSSTALFNNIAFKQGTQFTPVTVGTDSVKLEVRVAPATTGTPVLSPTVKLTAGKAYTIYARGFLGGLNNQALNASVIVNQ